MGPEDSRSHDVEQFQAELQLLFQEREQMKKHVRGSEEMNADMAGFPAASKWIWVAMLGFFVLVLLLALFMR